MKRVIIYIFLLFIAINSAFAEEMKAWEFTSINQAVYEVGLMISPFEYDGKVSLNTNIYDISVLDKSDDEKKEYYIRCIGEDNYSLSLLKEKNKYKLIDVRKLIDGDGYYESVKKTFKMNGPEYQSLWEKMYNKNSINITREPIKNGNIPNAKNIVQKYLYSHYIVCPEYLGGYINENGSITEVEIDNKKTYSDKLCYSNYSLDGTKNWSFTIKIIDSKVKLLEGEIPEE